MAIMEATELERVRKYAQVKTPRYNSVMRASGLSGGGGEMEWDDATGTVVRWSGMRGSGMR